MSHYIDIFEGASISPLFIKSQRKILKKYKNDIFSKKTDKEKFLHIESLWITEFEAHLCFNKSKNCWDKIFFEDTNKKMMFMLKT